MTQSNPPMSEAKTPEELAEERADRLFDKAKSPLHHTGVIEDYLAGYKQGSRDSAENNALISADLLAELEEQARLNGMGAEREASLLGKLEKAEADLQEAIEVIRFYAKADPIIAEYVMGRWRTKAEAFLNRVAAKPQGAV